MSTATSSTATQARYSAVEGIHVIRVAGSNYEMGRQHGELLKDIIPQGPLPYFRTYLERQVEASIIGALTPMVYPLIRQFVGKRVAKALPDFVRETLRGLSDGSGMPMKDLIDACTMPDSLLTVASRFMKFRRVGPAVHHRLALGLGCSSAIAWGEATRDGKLYHARNLDYYSVAGWTGTTTVAFAEPEDGQRFVSACAAGVPLGGVTAMNEAGLTLTVHQHMFTDRARVGGTPIGVAGDIVMRKAENLADAEAILSEYKPIGCWTYLVTDSKTHEVLCWEESPDRRAIRHIKPEANSFSYANIYLDPELGATECNLYGSYWRHNLGRQTRLNTMLRERHGQLDAQGVAEIIGDEGHPDCRISEAMAMLMTTGSVVFSPEDGRVWIGKGPTPTSHGDWLPFSLTAQSYDEAAPRLRTIPDVTSPRHEAFELYRQAYLSYFDDREPAKSLNLMDQALALQPKESLYHFLAGLLALRCEQPQRAEAELAKCLELSHPHPERLSAFRLWRARALDLLGRRPEALTDYQSALDGPADPPVHAAARKGLRRAFSARASKRFSIDFAFADVVTP